MKRVPKTALAALAALLLVGCCPCRSAKKRAQQPLAGTEWRLIQLGGRQFRPAPGSFTVTFLADGNQLAGVGACNRLTGTYTTDGSRTLRIGPIATTRMACPGEADELAFTRALESATHYDVDGQMLLLLSDGELCAVLQALPAASAAQ